MSDMPYDEDAERALIGSLMLTPDLIADVVTIVKGHEWFYEVKNQACWKALISLYNNHEQIDIVTFKDELNKLKLLDNAGGIDYVVELSCSVPRSECAPEYAIIVNDLYLRRLLIMLGEQTSRSAQENQSSSVIEDVTRSLLEITEHQQSNEGELLEPYYQTVIERVTSHTGKTSGLPTGFLELDEMLSGLHPGEMIVIAARPSMGKTSLGLGIAEHLAVMERVPVVFFSMEMTRDAIAERLLSMRSGVNAHRIRRGTLNAGELDLLQEAHEILIDSPLYVDDSTGLSSVELRSKARRMHKRYQVKAIFVDYLQLMRNRGRVENRQVEVSDFSRSIKSMAHSLMVPVIVLAQLNRNPEARTGNKPMLSDLRESGAIEQDADVVMLIHREEYYRRIKGEVPPDDIIGKAEIIVAKQRNGPTGSVTVQFNSDCAKFRPLAREYYEV